MSEYQYYAFRAIDRALTQAQLKELRALSTRARITSTSFVNEYHWGDFKGRPRELLERYFDFHFYYSNWGTRIVMLRVPKRRRQEEARQRAMQKAGLVPARA